MEMINCLKLMLNAFYGTFLYCMKLIKFESLIDF